MDKNGGSKQMSNADIKKNFGVNHTKHHSHQDKVNAAVHKRRMVKGKSWSKSHGKDD